MSQRACCVVILKKGQTGRQAGTQIQEFADVQTAWYPKGCWQLPVATPGLLPTATKGLTDVRVIGLGRTFTSVFQVRREGVFDRWEKSFTGNELF